MSEWFGRLSFGEFVVLIIVVFEIAIIVATLLLLLVMRRRAISREESHERARKEIADELANILDANDEGLHQRMLRLIRGLPADIARRLLTELAEYVPVESVGGLRRLYLESGLAEAARASALKRPWERLRVIRESRALNDPVDQLAELIKDDSPEVRLAAFEALCGLGRSEEALVALRLIAEDGRLSRLRVVEALAIAEPFPVEALRDLAKTDRAELREVIMGAFGRAHAREALDTLIEGVTDEDVEVRIQALRSLDEIGDPAALPACLSALNDEFWEVRSAAVRTCASLGGEGAAEAIAKLLDDDAEWVRHNGALALSRCGAQGLAALRAAAARGNSNASSALAEHRLSAEGS